jgi:hypothetical protein
MKPVVLFWATMGMSTLWALTGVAWMFLSSNPVMGILCCVIGIGCALVAMRINESNRL